jgi:hypothetical protein
LILAAGAFVAHGGPIMARLGFYHDDWALFSEMAAKGNSLLGIVAGMLRGTTHLYRPLSVVLWAIPYRLFGLDPLAWHLLMATLTAASGLVFFAVLRGFGAPTRLAVPAVLFYLAFPNKDATLFWPAVSLLQTTSILGLLLATREHQLYVRQGSVARLWKSCLFLVIGLCAYEQGFFLLPLYLLVPAEGPDMLRRRTKGAIAAACSLAAFALYRFGLVTHFVPLNKGLSASPGHFAFVYYMALRSLLDPRWVLYLLRMAWQALAWNPLLALCAAGLPLAAWGLLPPEKTPGRQAALRLISWGLGFCVLAYLPLCVSDYAPGAYDHMNRLNQLPALGLAAAACGAALLYPARAWALPAAAAMALVLSTAFAEVWAESYRRQLEVRDAVLRNLEAWPTDQLLMVRLPELYAARKAPIFLADYDVSAAIRLWTGEQGRRAFVRGAKAGRESPTLLLDMDDGRIVRFDRRGAASLPPYVEPWEVPLRLWPARK